MAVDILRKNSRRNVGAFGVVVFITDGYWNTGGNPSGNINQLKAEGVSIAYQVAVKGFAHERDMLRKSHGNS